MKAERFLLLFTAAFSIFCFNACFSPWAGDEGTIMINFGDSSRAFVNNGEFQSFRHEVYLRSPGGSLIKTGEFTGASGTVSAPPGTYIITVKGYSNEQLRSYGISADAVSGKEITIHAGVKNSVTVSMNSAVEVSDWRGLKEAFNSANQNDQRDLYIFIKNNISAGNDTAGIDLTGNVILITENTAEISGVNLDYLFYVSNNQISGSKLILKTAEGFGGNLILSGGSAVSTRQKYALIRVESGGYMEIHDNIEIKNHTNYSEPERSDRPEFSDNDKESTFPDHGTQIKEPNYGGGVYVGKGGNLYMAGGIISGNNSISGGGVYVSGIFTMTGGTISGNEANIGGGVFIDDGSFFKYGGTIYGMEEKSNSNTAFDGYAIFANFMYDGEYRRKNNTSDHNDSLEAYRHQNFEIIFTGEWEENEYWDDPGHSYKCGCHTRCDECSGNCDECFCMGKNPPLTQDEMNIIDFGDNLPTPPTVIFINNDQDFYDFFENTLAPGNYILNISTFIHLNNPIVIGENSSSPNEIIISLRGNGYVNINSINMIEVINGVKVILRDITLTSSGSDSVVKLSSNSTLIMQHGSVIHGMLHTERGIHVSGGSSFIMNGGEIYHVKTGVYVEGSRSSITKNLGGVIFGIDAAGKDCSENAVLIKGLETMPMPLSKRERTVKRDEVISYKINSAANGADDQTGIWD